MVTTPPLVYPALPAALREILRPVTQVILGCPGRADDGALNRGTGAHARVINGPDRVLVFLQLAGKLVEIQIAANRLWRHQFPSPGIVQILQVIFVGFGAPPNLIFRADHHRPSTEIPRRQRIERE